MTEQDHTDETPENKVPAQTGEVHEVGVRHGMFGVRGSGDTSGYGGLVQPTVFPGESQRPYGGWYDEVADALVAAAQDAGLESMAPRVVIHRGEITFHVRREDLPVVAKLLRDDEYGTVRPRLAREAGAALAAIHAMPLAEVEDALDEHDPLASMGALLDGFDPHPAFELGLRWLERHRPPRIGRVVVHGDFRTGNLLVDPDGLVAVLDWELAHVGDPAEDVGWFCGRAWRFGSPHRAGGFGPVDELLAGYRDAGGPDLDLETVRWWEAYGTLRWGLVCLVQAQAHLSGMARSVELATIGRRASEAEWDLLEAIS